MQDIKIERYENASLSERTSWGQEVSQPVDSWQGYVEPEDKSWILFIDAKGRPVLYPTRNKETGAVTSEPLYDKETFPEFQK